MKKLFSLVLVLGFALTLAGCSAMNNAEKRLEDEGYTLVAYDDEEFANFIEGDEDDLADLENIYTIESDDDRGVVGSILEFKNADALIEALEADGEDPSDHEDAIHKNLYIIASQDIIDIIKGD